MRITTVALHAAVVGISLAAAGCGGSGPGDSPDGATPEPDAGEPAPFQLRGACPLEQRLGAFVVEVQDAFSIVDGDVANGVIPVTILEDVLRDGDCALLRKRNPFCDPPCAAGQTCDFDGTCIAFPQKQDVGVVTITGLLDPVRMEPLQPSNDYFATGLTHPVFEPGAEVRLTSTAGAYGRLSLFGRGAQVLEPLDARWNVTEGQPLEVAWQAPDAADDTRVLLRLTIDQHGNTPVTLTCDFDDDGAGQIAQPVIDALVQFGVSGFPNGTLSRRTVDSQQVADGCVEMVVATPRSRDVRVTGHTPCNIPADCPQGQTCDIPNQTCI